MTNEKAIEMLEYIRQTGNGESEYKNNAQAIAINMAIKALSDRPQGEWIRTGRTNIYGGIEVQCSNCNDKVMVQHLEDEWYCRHCGADMGMKGEDNECL